MAKRRTAAQIRATKKLVAMNKRRSRGNPKTNMKTPDKFWGPPLSGYVVYPSGLTRKTLAVAKADAKRASLTHGRAHVESAASGKIVARYEWGKQVRYNPSRRKSKKEFDAWFGEKYGKPSKPEREATHHTRKRIESMKRAGRIAAKRAAKRNPRRKKAPTLTLAQGRKLYELGRRAPKTAVSIKKNGKGCSIVTGKAARKLQGR
jgi:hypothetical protein